MPLFAYKARMRNGEAIDGVMEAISSDSVAEHLIGQGITPVDIALSDSTRSREIDVKKLFRDLFPHKVSHTDLIQFSRQMHSLTRAGVPLLSALGGVVNSSANPALSSAIQGVLENLESGLDLASSMSHCPQVFSNFYVNLVRVGETSGTLDMIFLELARYLERDHHTRMQIKRALRYPTFVLVSIISAIFAINTLVIPTFATVFAQFHAKLPWTTRVLIYVSDFTVQYWPQILLAMVAAVIAWLRYIGSSKGRLWWDKSKLSLPLIGNLMHRAILARFSRLFAMSARAGVPIVTGLNVVAKAMDNVFIQNRINDMQDGLQQGDSLTHSAAATGIMDSLVLQMISIGEESGSVDELLDEVATFYDREVEYEIEKLSSAIEPVLTVVIAGIVLLLALGVFLPMWDMSAVALGRAH